MPYELRYIPKDRPVAKKNSFQITDEVVQKKTNLKCWQQYIY